MNLKRSYRELENGMLFFSFDFIKRFIFKITKTKIRWDGRKKMEQKMKRRGEKHFSRREK